MSPVIRHEFEIDIPHCANVRVKYNVLRVGQLTVCTESSPQLHKLSKIFRPVALSASDITLKRLNDIWGVPILPMW